MSLTYLLRLVLQLRPIRQRRENRLYICEMFGLRLDNKTWNKSRLFHTFEFLTTPQTETGQEKGDVVGNWDSKNW